MATGNTNFKVEHGLLVVGNTEIEQNLIISGSANVVGDLTVGGSVVFTANVTGNFVPDVSGRSLGNTSNRWDMYANSLSVSNTATFQGDTIPNANGVSLGTADRRWFAYTTNINVSNTVTISNSASVSNVLTVSGRLAVGPSLSIQSNSVVYSNTVVGPTVVDQFSATAFRATKYLIEIQNATTGFMAEELLLIHDGTTVFLTEYGVVNTIATFCTFNADISSGNVRLIASPTTNATFKIARLMLD